MDICISISKGTCDNNIAERSPGAMSHARWLTTANRILRLYVATLNPWKELTDLVKFILTVYAPAWFLIKQNKSCIDGTENLFQIVKSCRYLSGEQKNVVQRSIQHNAYFAHPEQVLLSMIFDMNESNRAKAIAMIESASPQTTVRKFHVPTLNFNANSCYSLINLNKLQITVPPLISHLKSDSLKNLFKSDFGNLIRNIPCHSQAVERSVKLVTEAASSVTEENRHGFILNKLTSRQKMPKIGSKIDFAL